MAETILVVDDEKPIADILKYNLEKEGFRVEVALDGEGAVAAAERCRPDLVILDIMLPGLDGFAVCRKIRASSMVPILMLTAKGDEVDKVLGLELGADDYVTKPFSTRELLARVKALLRRSQAAAGASAQTGQVIRAGDLAIDLVTYEVTKRGQPVPLTFREFELLKEMALHPGQVFSRESLLERVWGYDYPGDIRTVDVTVRRLREKVEDDPGEPQFVQTRRGVGYLFRRP